MDFFSLFITDFRTLLPEIFLVTVLCLLLVYGVVYSTSTSKGCPVLLQNMCWLGSLSLCFTVILVFENPIEHAKVFYNCFIIDSLTTYLKLLTLITSLFCILMSKSYLRIQRINSFEYVLFILLSTCGMLFLISSYDLITMFLSMELQSFCLYVLAASKRKCEFSTEAGLKYFILGAFSSGIILFGCSFIYGFTGITNLEDLVKVFGCLDSIDFHKNTIVLGILFLMVGFLFKLTAAPFHMWGPDVYEGSPTSVTAFFSTAPKIAVLGFFLRIFLTSCYDLLPFWKWILILSSIASIFVSCLTAMSETKLKRLLAFSSIGHIGILLMGLSCGSVESVQAALLYLIIYTVMSINMFASILSLDQPSRTNKWQVSSSYLYIYDFHRLSNSNPLLAFNLTMILFSMAGVPPLAGFCSKFFVFFSLLNSSLYALALLAVLASVISSFYYIRIVKTMYFEKRETTWTSYQPMSRENSLLVSFSLGFVMLFFIYPSPFFLLTQFMSLSILF